MLRGQDSMKYKIIIVGDPYVGKTALFWQYTDGQFLTDCPSSVTTIDFKIKDVSIQNTPVKLYIWDTAGQEKYRSIVSTYFKGCDGIVLVFDLTNPISFSTATTKWYQLAKTRAPEAQILLVGNKCDLDVKIDQKQAQLWAKDHGALYVRVSVKRDYNVGECFKKLSQAIYQQPCKSKSKSIILNRNSTQKKKQQCC